MAAICTSISSLLLINTVGRLICPRHLGVEFCRADTGGGGGGGGIKRWW